MGGGVDEQEGRGRREKSKEGIRDSVPVKDFRFFHDVKKWV